MAGGRRRTFAVWAAIAVLSSGLGVVAPGHVAGASPMAHTTTNCEIRSRANGRYASSELADAGALLGILRARTVSPGKWEQFQCVAVGTNKWAFKSRANNRYVTAELGYKSALNGVLRARSTAIGSWETFTIASVSGCECSTLRAANGRYVSAELGYRGTTAAVLRARTVTPGAWERFDIDCLRCRVVGPTATSPGNDGKLQQSIATCPKPDVVVGGGIQWTSVGAFEDDTSSFPTASLPGLDDQWEVDAETSGGAGTFRAFAICEPKPAGYALAHGPLVDATAAYPLPVTSTATCPVDTVVLGGGAHVSGVTDGNIADMQDSFPDTTTSWQAGGLSPEPGTDLQTWAVCATQPTGYATVDATPQTSSGIGITTIDDPCPASTTATGGGIQNIPQMGQSAQTDVNMYPSSDTNWSVSGQTGSNPSTFTAWVVCSKPS